MTKKKKTKNEKNPRLSREEIQKLATGLIETLAQSKSESFTLRQLYKKMGLTEKEEKENIREIVETAATPENSTSKKEEPKKESQEVKQETKKEEPKTNPNQNEKKTNSSQQQNQNNQQNQKQTAKETTRDVTVQKQALSNRSNRLDNEQKDEVKEVKSHTELQKNEYIGTVDAGRDSSYIICEGLEEDAWVGGHKIKGAINGDIVKIKLTGKQKGKNPEAEVVEIIERGRTEFVGNVQLFNRFAFVVVESKKMKMDIFVPLDNLNGATNDDKVIVKIVKWTEEKGKNPVGEVTEILGKAGENEAEIHAIMVEFGLPMDFDEKLIKKAEEVKDDLTPQEFKKRRDFRPVLTFTIDPHDAKDFDDAISLAYLPNGNYEIGVHIADVTHYIKPNTLLEKEAQKRATSVYLVDRVVPMLPERISNNLCSLRPQEEKLAFSAVFELDKYGSVRNRWYGKTVIYSDRRFTYEEAQERIETKEGDYADEINVLNDLAKKLQAKRFKHGAISFETQEVKFQLDENGKPLGVIPKVRKDAHKLVEEFMLLANKSVAEFVYRYKNGKEKNTMIYRVHDDPYPDKLANLKAMAKTFGYDINVEPEHFAASLAKLVQETEGKPEYETLQSLAIRSMAKAIYTTKAIGHFGLAFEHYSHFTSPIRRYPDMMAHRLIEKYLKNNIKSVDPAKYESMARHSSDMEKRASDAERASIRYKQAEFMDAHIGEVFDGMVTGVTEWGLYVEITSTACEGMIRLSDLKGDYYEYEPKNQRVVGRKSNKTYTLGNKVEVRVKGVDMEKRTIDLLMETEEEEYVSSNKSRKPHTGRRR
ncbi:MAG: ribonuclease R [Flexibacter sp. CG_4_10_14_3_um_filter_32_15]|nr:MAG: ribonuclease R [Flexibacter sp. CG_4_10_14_3_um_filter_32_15]